MHLSQEIDCYVSVCGLDCSVFYLQCDLVGRKTLVGIFSALDAFAQKEN